MALMAFFDAREGVMCTDAFRNSAPCKLNRQYAMEGVSNDKDTDITQQFNAVVHIVHTAAQQ